MAEFWYKLVASGEITIDEVPAKFRSEVRILMRHKED